VIVAEPVAVTIAGFNPTLVRLKENTVDVLDRAERFQSHTGSIKRTFAL